jgi:hypothetical protein
MRNTSFLLVQPYAHARDDARLPIWACATAILAMSGTFYWLLFRLIETIGRL